MKQLLKNYLKDPLSTIAINTTIFIMGCLFFGSLATFGIVSEFVRDYNDPPQNIRHQHIQQQLFVRVLIKQLFILIYLKEIQSEVLV